MSTTKYQVLYRYINESTNTVITNSDEYEYEAVCEFYTDPNHKIFMDEYKIEAIQEQQEMITYGNSVDNIKTNMLFAYDGPKKIFNKKWIPEEEAYIIKDWTLLKREEIGNEGDYSKKYITIDGKTPELGGKVLIKAKDIKNAKLFKDYQDVFSTNGKSLTYKSNYNYTLKEFENEVVTPQVNLVLKDNDLITKCLKPCNTVSKKTTHNINSSKFTDYIYSNNDYDKYNSYKNFYYNENSFGETYYWGSLVIGNAKYKTIYPTTNFYTYLSSYEEHYGNRITVYRQDLSSATTGYSSSEGLYNGIAIKEENLEKTVVPGHYEEQKDAPYIIIDTYKKIKLSPWFINCQCSSLNTAIEKAKLLTEIIGIDNVKVIKLVPIDQRIKIK